MKERVADRFRREFGAPARELTKVLAWDLRPGLGAVLEIDQPKREDTANVWLPYPADGQPVPDLALEYPAEAGRHSNTYPSSGLERGKPALKLILRDSRELDDTVRYIQAMELATPLPEVRASMTAPTGENRPLRVDHSAMPRTAEPKPRREAIPRAIQREVWQRDGGRCVECSTRERLCFDHIVPFSRGGSNTIRNLQLLCESCNSSKGNRI